ncbi:MAG: SDR family oxidoreductase [Clostridia bacterium]|nr:SDR family oxidoreductase [Clostridia bacterium]
MEPKKAIVTGGSRGIGNGICLKLAEAGYDIATNYSTASDEAEALAKTIHEKYGRKCYYYQASLDQPNAGEELMEKCIRDLGGLDLLVNNAGVTRFFNILEIPIETFDMLINLDFRTYILNARYAAAYMIKHGIQGNIINITSSRGERAYPGDAVYGGCKAGLNRAIQSMALDLGPYGIRVNNVAPGATDVRDPKGYIERMKQHGIIIDPNAPNPREVLGKKIPCLRTGKPLDIANAVLFLASEEASYITGCTLRVDGGLILAGMPEWNDPANTVTDDAGWAGRKYDLDKLDLDYVL